MHVWIYLLCILFNLSLNGGLTHEQEAIITRAEKFFFTIASFKTLIEKTRAAQYPEGFIYEIEKASALVKKQQERVDAFGLFIQFKRCKKEIDIVTESRFLECKNTSWKLPPDGEKQLKQQFKEQCFLTKKYNEEHGTNFIYMVCSKQPIPDTWKTWFKKQCIRYEEG